MNRLLPLLLLCLTGLPAQAQTVAVTGARVIPVVGDEIEDGVVLIRDGRIVAVGTKDAVKIPYDAQVLEAPGQVVFPGMVLAHSSAGLDRRNESLPVAPFLDVYDSLNPASFELEDLLREGVTSVHVIQGDETSIGGVGRVLQPLGLTVESMTLRAPSGLKISVSDRDGYDRIRQRAELREAFAELEDYLDGQAESRFQSEQARLGKGDEKVAPQEMRAKGRELLRPEDLDDKHRNLFLLTRGKLDAFVTCKAATDVPYAIAMATELGFLERTVFVLGGECWKAADVLAQTKRPVILPEQLVYRETDPETGEEVETFVPSVFAEAGIPFALQVSPRTSFAERFLWYQAARCVAHGVSRDRALASITLEAARLLGVGDQVGSLETGKLANLLVLSGDPLDATTHVERVLLRGKVVYEREKDFRLRRLLEGEVDAEGAVPEGDVHEDEVLEEVEPDDSGETPIPPAETPPAETPHAEEGQ